MPKTAKKKGGKQSLRVPWVRGFKRPTKKQAEKALKSGTDDENPIDPDLFSAKGFEPVPQPSSADDWLAQYNEDGQGYSDFLAQCPWFGNRKMRGISMPFIPTGRCISDRYANGKIYLVPLGIVDPGSCPDYEDIREFAEIFFGCEVQLLPELKLELRGTSRTFLTGEDRRGPFQIEVDCRINKSNRRYQLRVISILAKLRDIIPEDGLVLVAFTTSDLFGDRSDLFVAGMAAGNHRVGVFSFYRYNPGLSFSPEKWYEVKQPRRKKVGSDPSKQRLRLMLQRSCRLLVHEICHLFGLAHCIWYNCLMNGSGHLEEDFSQSMFLCPVDLRKLSVLFGFSIIDRYRKLAIFYSKHEMEDEFQWIDERLNSFGLQDEA